MPAFTRHDVNLELEGCLDFLRLDASELGGATQARGETQTALLNILEDFGAERDRMADTQRAVLNILEDFGSERDRITDAQRAVLNILDDFSSEKVQLEKTQRAILNILDDFSAEQARIAMGQRAMLNILEDFSAEKQRLEDNQKAVLNILDDFENEKIKVEEANRLLVRRSEELAWSNAELEQFAYVASHDLQEPLRMVANFVALLQKRYQGQIDEKADKYIFYAVDGAKRMQELIEGLLEYSRAGRREIGTEAVDLDAVLKRVLSNLGPAVAESGAQFDCGPLPSVVGNRQQISQVFLNLLSNAIKFRQPGVRPRIVVSARKDGPGWVFSVKDNGIGCDPRYSDKIFSIFQRLHGRSEYPGTGIGLAVCKKVVERHGGKIWLESGPGEGANFLFTLPAPDGESADAPGCSREQNLLVSQ